MNARAFHRAASRARGVTMIELLVVMVIIAILATMAMSSYRAQVTKATRAAAKSCLTQYAQFMERYNTTQFTYVGAAPVLGCASESSMGARYVFAVDTLAATTYRVTATPTTAWASRDSRCGTLTLNQTGARSAGSGSAADVTYCW